MQTFRYDSDLIGGSLMVRESRIVADLLLSGTDQAAWKAAIHDENRLQKARPATARRMSQAIRKRLKRALRRWVWNSPPELGQDMASTTTGGMAWTAPRF